MSKEHAAEHFRTLGAGYEELENFVRQAVGDVPALLVGSVAEGLSNRDSDIDILVLAGNSQDGMTYYSPQFEVVSAVRHPAGFDVQFEFWPIDEMKALCERFRLGMNQLITDSGSKNSRFALFSDPECTALQRLRSGLVISQADKVAEIRQKYMLDYFPVMMFFRNIGLHFSFLEDTLAQAEGGDVDTAFGMLRLSMTFLGMSLVNSAGVTVVNTKWCPKLLKQNSAIVGPSEVEQVLSFLRMGVSQEIADLAARAATASSEIVASIVRRIPAYGPGLENYQARLGFRTSV